MHVFVLNCNTMHDHRTESHGHVLFRITRGNTSGTCIETRFNLFQSVLSRTNTHYWYIVHCQFTCRLRGSTALRWKAVSSVILIAYIMLLTIIYFPKYLLNKNLHCHVLSCYMERLHIALPSIPRTLLCYPIRTRNTPFACTLCYSDHTLLSIPHMNDTLCRYPSSYYPTHYPIPRRTQPLCQYSDYTLFPHPLW